MTSLTLGYARTSTKHQSTASQLNELTEWSKSNGVELDRVFVDAGISGSVPCLERDQFNRMASTLRKGDTLIVWWVDRLGRDYFDAKTTIETLLKRGVVVRTINQNMVFTYNGSTQDRMTTDIMITLLVGLAAAEKENRRASQDAGRAALKVEGAVSKKTGKNWEQSFKGRKADTQRNEQIATLLIEGKLSIRKIADQVGCNPSTVQRIKKQLEE